MREKGYSTLRGSVYFCVGHLHVASVMLSITCHLCQPQLSVLRGLQPTPYSHRHSHWDPTLLPGGSPVGVEA